MVQSLAQLEALAGDEMGRSLIRQIASKDLDPKVALASGERLRRQFPADLVAAAMNLLELRQRAAAKFERAAAMWFTRAGLEQATSESVARRRARRFIGAARIADLCCGIGGDLIALAEYAPVLAVDRDPLHVRMATLNADVYDVGERVATLAADATVASLADVDAIFIDPARRTGDRRLGRDLSEPPLAWCLALGERVSRVGIKAAPGVDVDTVPPGWEIEFVAVDRDLKEAALYSPGLATAARRATVLPAGQSLIDQPGEPIAIAAPGAYLLDPNPAVTRAGLVEALARQVGAWKIDEEIAFLAVDRPARTPFARALRVVDSLPWHQTSIADRLRSLDIGAVDIRRRGLPGDVETIRRGFKLRGSGRATLAMTRHLGRPWCLICLDLAGQEARSPDLDSSP